MAGLALLARGMGYQVSGSDDNVYPPMSHLLEKAGIKIYQGYKSGHLDINADLYVIGNALSRGNEQVEAILDRNLPFISGPQWLFEHLLRDRWVLAVAGTHGKTTTAGMLAWILDYAGLDTGFLIGGVTRNFNTSARLGQSPFFVIEADEYDTAFFDKRSKFVHYHPRTLVLNNLEFDHADIFDNLDAIKRQFHHLVRIVPRTGLIIFNEQDDNLSEVMQMGCWSETQSFGINQADMTLQPETDRLIDHMGNQAYTHGTGQKGIYNQLNASAAILAARHAGVPVKTGIAAMKEFKGVKRRQEVIAEINGITIIDDFAHHPTAISVTLQALKMDTRGKLIAVFEPRSNTMTAGHHADSLAEAFNAADMVLLYDNGLLKWNLQGLAGSVTGELHIFAETGKIVAHLVRSAKKGDRIVIMSNGGFDSIQHKLIAALGKK